MFSSNMGQRPRKDIYKRFGSVLSDPLLVLWSLGRSKYVRTPSPTSDTLSFRVSGGRMGLGIKDVSV